MKPAKPTLPQQIARPNGRRSAQVSIKEATLTLTNAARNSTRAGAWPVKAFRGMQVVR